MIYKRCIRCGRRLKVSETCECMAAGLKEKRKAYDESRRNPKARAFYQSKSWKRMRMQILDRYGMDVWEAVKTGRQIPADTVHHITPLMDDWSRRLDPENLMPVSRQSHAEIERMYDEDKANGIARVQDALKRFQIQQCDG